LSFAAMSVKMTILLDPQTHLVRRTIADVKGLMEQARTPDVKVATITVDYAKVSPEAKLDAAHFAWTPPAGARPISPSSAPPERDHGHDDEEDER
jgi:outer membrane lipoprotein-sorting protein